MNVYDPDKPPGERLNRWVSIAASILVGVVAVTLAWWMWGAILRGAQW